MKKGISWGNRIRCIVLLLTICFIGIGKIIWDSKEIKELSKEKLNGLVNVDYNVESLVAEGNDTKLNILGDLELEEVKNISKKIYNKMPKESKKTGEIVFNFFGVENDCKEKVKNFYKEGMSHKININCETKEMVVNSFEKTKVKVSDIGMDSEAIVLHNEKAGRIVNVFGGNGEKILEGSKDLNQVIKKINN